MRNQTKYLLIYLVVLGVLLGSVLQLAQTQNSSHLEDSETIALDQAELDQMLAPIALYPDTLLSHILVAATYPLEVIQAARWRAANADLDENQALNAVEHKDWDPSVKALVPFNDLLQTLSEDLDWLQSLGSAFLVDEQLILDSVQHLRQKAYEQGNLTDNDYVNIERERDEIIIETVRKEVVYVPYYDTRVVYGNWWWHNHQPYYWHRPIHSVLRAGLYWSAGFSIRPRFYFGGFHWRKRHIYANYNYRKHAKRRWSNHHTNRQIVRAKEYPRWSHNQHHRRGVQHRVNGQHFVRNSKGGYKKHKPYYKKNKQRVLNTKHYKHKGYKHTLNKQKAKKFAKNKQYIANKKRQNYKTEKYAKSHYKKDKSQKYVAYKGNKKSKKHDYAKVKSNKSYANKSHKKSYNNSKHYEKKTKRHSQHKQNKVKRHSKNAHHQR